MAETVFLLPQTLTSPTATELPASPFCSVTLLPLPVTVRAESSASFARVTLLPLPATESALCAPETATDRPEPVSSTPSACAAVTAETGPERMRSVPIFALVGSWKPLLAPTASVSVPRVVVLSIERDLRSSQRSVSSVMFQLWSETVSPAQSTTRQSASTPERAASPLSTAAAAPDFREAASVKLPAMR